MLDILDHFSDILIGAAILFLVPLLYIGLKQDALIRTVVSEQTEQFVDETRSLGYLSKDMCEDFQQSLSKTGLLYDIKLEHKLKILEPEYRFRTLEEVLEEQNNAFIGTNVYHYYPISTNIPVVTDPIHNDGLTMNTETNASILAGATYTPAPAGHVHNDSCYAGHIHKGANNLTFTHNHAHNVGQSCTRYTSLSIFQVHCNSCGTDYSWTAAAYYWNNGPVTAWVNTSGTNNCWECNSTNLRLEYTPQDRYTCTYDVDINGNGFYDAVPNGEYRQYPGRSAPQSDTRATHVSGCYTYHVSNTMREHYEYYEYSGVLNESSARNAFSQIFWYDKFPEYCEIPTYYDIGISTDSNDDGFDLDDVPNTAYLRYKAFVDTDGSVKFQYQWYWQYTGPYEGYGEYHYNNPGFEPVLTFSEFKNMYYNIKQIYKTVVGVDYDARYEPNPDNHLHWYFKKMEYNSSTGNYYYVDGTTYLSICGFDHSLGIDRWVANCGLIEDATIVCNQKVTSILPTHPVQSVYTNEDLITTVKATYQDGSQNIVLATASFSTETPATNQIITLTYTDSRGITKTCTITVNVIPQNRTCSHGHIYNLSNDGSDPGCPYCKAWLGSLVIEFPITPTFTIYRGTTLAENGVTLLATYLDGHTELLGSEYLDNLDKYYVGSQNVTMSYKGHYVYLTVVTKRNLKLCTVCHRQYELHPDDADPGCPWCAARTPIFTGNVMQYYSKRYTNEILKELYEGTGIYRFTDEDYITVSVKNRKGSIGTSVLSAIYRNKKVNTLHVIEAGYIREDGYDK